MKTTHALLSATIAPALLAGHAAASTVEVTSFGAANPAVPVADAWYFNDMRDGGTATIVDLTGLGGDLENNQPLPLGAARLTTGFANNDKADVATYGDFGSAQTVLTTGTFGYDYYKEDVAGGNAFAGPSLKLSLFAAGGTGDNFGQLIYEPNWNQPGGGSSLVPTDAWQSVTIDSTTGAGDDATGGWWWTGGFDVGSSAGGPPLKSLAEWAAIFAASDPTDFANAHVVAIAVGVGTYNQGQVGYFDNVSIQAGAIDTTYDFNPVPEPGSIALLGLGGLALMARRRRA